MREDINTASEYVFLGFRMENGIDLAEYDQLFSTDLISSYAREIDSLTVLDLSRSTMADCVSRSVASCFLMRSLLFLFN